MGQHFLDGLILLLAEAGSGILFFAISVIAGLISLLLRNRRRALSVAGWALAFALLNGMALLVTNNAFKAPAGDDTAWRDWATIAWLVLVGGGLTQLFRVGR